MEVRSRRYGTRTMFNTAANHQPENYHETTTRASYHNPKTHDKPNYRSRDHSQVFENSAKLLVHKRSDSHASGYETNRQLWDSTGWGTEKNLHSDMYRTAYRNNFNQPKPFHKPELKVTNGRLIRKEQVFDVADKWRWALYPLRISPLPHPIIKNHTQIKQQWWCPIGKKFILSLTNNRGT